MRFGSVCSGMEAASLAWLPLGWTCAFVSEIDEPACAVLSARFADVPNLGDLLQWRTWPEDLLASIDVLIGGTPCQGFSFAGLRRSLSDERSNLALNFLELADAIDTIRRARGLEPVVIVWENVPGVYSASDNAFGCFLGGLVGADAPLVPGRNQRWTHAGVVAGPARKAAWRTLDAQFFGLAQRRARCFVIASAGAVCPSAVLLERSGLQGNPPPRREAGQDVAGTLGGSSQSGGFRTTDRDNSGAFIPVPILDGAKGRGTREGAEASRDGSALGQPGDPMFTLRSNSAHAVAIPFDPTQITNPDNRSNPQLGDPVHALAANQHMCAPVNLAKRDMGDEEFFALCGDVIRWLGERIELAAREG